MDGFGDGHEVALHLRVGDGDRPSLGDLPLEEGHHAPPAAEDVPKADAGVAIPQTLGHILHQEFGDGFGDAHGVDGVDGFVGGDEDEAGDAKEVGGLEHGVRAEDVVGDGLDHVLLHEGDVLVGRGVEDDIGLVTVEDGVEAGAVTDVGDDGVDLEVGGWRLEVR